MLPNAVPESRKRPFSVEYLFRSVIANLIVMMKIGKSDLIVPRNKRFFRARSRYRPSQATYASVIKMLNATVTSGLLHEEIGSGKHKLTVSFHGELESVREATKVKPSEYLAYRLEPFLTRPVHEFVQWRNGVEVIHLRDKKRDEDGTSSSEPVPYDDTLLTNRFRTQVRLINQHVKQHPCHYAGSHRVNLMDDQVIRIFNNGGWNQGGRLYGYWPMNLTKGERFHLTIDGEPLADLDFGSCFVALLHVHDGTEFDPAAPDPFSIEGYEPYRDAIKQCAYAILNAAHRIKNYPKNVTPQDGSRPPLRWREMEEVIFGNIPLFDKYAYSALGLRLMRKESDILIAVLLDLIEQGVGFIPMHDGIMVPRSKANLTRRLMLRHYESITGQQITVKEKPINAPAVIQMDQLSVGIPSTGSQ